MSESPIRPSFVADIQTAYNLRGKNVILVTGDVHGLFPGRSKSGEMIFYTIEQALRAALEEKFTLVRMDMATGISFYDDKSKEVLGAVGASNDAAVGTRPKVTDLEAQIDRNRHNPLPTLVLLESLAQDIGRLRAVGQSIKPLAVILQHAGSLFPQGNVNALTEIDRQRLVFFLTWVSSPLFAESPDLIVLVNPVRSEVNAKITALSNSEHIEIQLPNENDRYVYAEHFAKGKSVQFEAGIPVFARDSAGLTISHIRAILESSASSGRMVSRKMLADEVSKILQANLQGIAKFPLIEHTVEDIVGYAETKAILADVFERCDDPATAVSAVLISGPNGVGKTYLLEAHARASGRVVIELGGIRGSYFGETDNFFELLRWHVTNFGKILILVDEAHTAFGSVHAEATHETEKRLAGNILKMMGNPVYLGKVLWGLMTSRPDELDPDVKSRAPIQIPIFDLEGEERKAFVKDFMGRKGIQIAEGDMESFLAKTGHYSARDYWNLASEFLARRKKHAQVTILEVLETWDASRAIIVERAFQELVASQHCSYPKLLPERIRKMDPRKIVEEIEVLRSLLRRT